MNTIFDTFVFSQTTAEQIEALPPDLQLKYFWAVTNFGLNGVEPEFDNCLERAVWIPMRDLIIASKRKSEDWIEKQREAGKKGGAPQGNKNAAGHKGAGGAPTGNTNASKTDTAAEVAQESGVEYGSVFVDDFGNRVTQQHEDEIPYPKTTTTSEITTTETTSTPNGNGNGNGNGNYNEKDNVKGVEVVFSFFSQKQQKNIDLPIPDNPDKTRLWIIAQTVWNELRLTPDSRGFSPRGSDSTDVFRTFDEYTPLEVCNAIANYWWHIKKAGVKYVAPPKMGDGGFARLEGFLKTGVPRYYDDDAFDKNFLKNGAKKPP